MLLESTGNPPKDAAEKIRRLEARLAVLSKATHAFAEAASDTAHLLEVVAKLGATAVGDVCVVFMLSDDEKVLLPRASYAVDEAVSREVGTLFATTPVVVEGNASAQRMLRTRKATLLRDIATEEEPSAHPGARDADEPPGGHGVLLVALRVGDRAIGALGLRRAAQRSPPFDDADRELAEDLADHASLALGNAGVHAAERAALEAADNATAALARVEGALAQAREVAEAASRELETFSYSVAHDLRAPLRGMSGFAHILLEDHADKLDADGKDCLDEIETNAQKMGALIDALLSLSRVTRCKAKPERIDLSAVARGVFSELAAAAPERHVELVVQDDLRADVDPSLALALMQNLLGNAWKFTSNVAAPRIDVGSVVEGGQRAFFVRDNGAGYDMAHAAKLFAPFQRLHTVAEFPGTGIGLATAQRIVHRHGGRIWAEGSVGSGAVFYFTLPSRGGVP